MAKGLGKGISAFFPDAMDEKQEQIQEVSLSELRPNPYQPRKYFSEESITELKDSILNHGILQPILVRKSIKGYEIVVGERRYRAATEAGLKTVPVVIKELTEDKMMEFALIENLQREDLNSIEEAVAYDKLMKHLKLTQEQLAKRLGKSRPHIANHLRLLQLPNEVQALIEEGELSMGHGRALLGLKNKEKLVPLLKKVLEEGLNVRQLEQIIQNLNENVSRETIRKKQEPSIFIKEKEEYLRDRFGTSVAIKKNKKRGKIEIQFYSEDDLERILSLLEGN
ncbi:ParB/RepB/Spo0J family partition protein [Anaerobacillus isosaccharinicus]|uniref:Chromosome partitioning protein ParB n=1 Tax=Anaerobacillus isosaccharinicus TaxID=1532552 RepID=A0A1S2MFQ1_9BACI|nr:ParB/RepB/Spo0J family partition protein [Anaerobacillus isosaccharinicus]MBA5584219.1 ParB/RepB/Spo0J family partition protein [Anaerobacillus isosaccharinicus]QOY37379.1 ParB/RepB/Spo0J family partition protein [Anaerobacillus isosaccharinicus]